MAEVEYQFRDVLTIPGMGLDYQRVCLTCGCIVPTVDVVYWQMHVDWHKRLEDKLMEIEAKINDPYKQLLMSGPVTHHKPWMYVDKDRFKKFCWCKCSCGYKGPDHRLKGEESYPHIQAFLDWRVHLPECPHNHERGVEL